MFRVTFQWHLCDSTMAIEFQKGKMLRINKKV